MWQDVVLFAAIVLLAFALRLTYVLQSCSSPLFKHPQMDELYHDEWAQAIAAGETFTEGPYFRAPLYPAFLGADYTVFGHELAELRVAVSGRPAGLQSGRRSHCRVRRCQLLDVDLLRWRTADSVADRLSGSDTHLAVAAGGPRPHEARVWAGGDRVGFVGDRATDHPALRTGDRDLAVREASPAAPARAGVRCLGCRCVSSGGLADHGPQLRGGQGPGADCVAGRGELLYRQQPAVGRSDRHRSRNAG